MKKIIYFLIITIFIININHSSQEDYLKIDTRVAPKNIFQGEEGILKIKITPKEGIKISSHPEFIIKLHDNSNLVFPKIFFTASELNYQTKQEDNVILLDLEKEIEIPFKVNDNSLIGRHKISGEIIFTAIFKDNWSLKTYQKFITNFFSKKKYKRKKR
jgi:hypothetical protein